MINVRRTAALGLLVLSSLALVVYAKRSASPTPPPPLGIEIALAKTFYVPAATGNNITTIVLRVPSKEGADPEKEISAVKLEPRMERGKVSVAVYALRGHAESVKTCRDWDALQSTTVGTYVAGLDEEVSLVKLKELGADFGKDPLTFRVVPKKALSPLPQAGSSCGCAACDGLICCPNAGYCLKCDSCGFACCSSNEY